VDSRLAADAKRKMICSVSRLALATDEES